MFGLACDSLIGFPLRESQCPSFSAVNFLVIEPESYFVGFMVFIFITFIFNFLLD
jgi:hypothetical protein